MKIAIVDDEQEIHEQIKKNITEFLGKNSTNIIDFFSGEELLNSEMIPDIIFLDIEMQGKNGIDTAEELRKKYPDIIIIFVSSHGEYVFDAFRCEALHFIVKPIDETEFGEIFGRALHKYRLINNYFPISYNQIVGKFRVDDIIFIENYKRHLIFHTATGNYEHKGKLSGAYEALEAHGFIYVHQGIVVNLKYIRRILQDKVELSSGETVLLARRKRSEVFIAFNNYISKWKW